MTASSAGRKTVADGKYFLQRLRAQVGIFIVLCALAILCALNGCTKPPAPEPAIQKTPDWNVLATSLINTQQPVALRKDSLHLLCTTKEGADLVLRLAEKLPMDLRLSATLEFAQLPWADLRITATNLFPPLLFSDFSLVPRLSQLLLLRGKPQAGEALFKRTDLNCIGCHPVLGNGVTVGSDLSDIGLRMDRESIIENILDPSAIISTNFETWQIITQSGDESYGLLSADTPAYVEIKDLKANITRIKKSDIRLRQQIPISIMPAGLQQAVSLQEFTDLIEYLMTLQRVQRNGP